MRLLQKHLDKALREHDQIVRAYREKYSRRVKRDWRTYEQRLALRVKAAAQELLPVVEKACSMIDVSKTRGRPSKIPVTKKILILLLKDVFQLSNRKMANFLAFFTALTGIDVSYKTVERIYSDELARMTIHNMFMVMAERKNIKDADTSGDGTGYSLTITKHYRNEREKELKNETDDDKGRRDFVYAFSLMDLKSKMYIGYGASLKSEKEAFHKARKMAEGLGISINSVRLDKLYSHQSITREFSEKTAIYIIPKKNATIRGSQEWKRIIRSFVDDHISHLKEYYKRNNSESGYSADKRLCGWRIRQKRPDRIDLALMCKGVWHNLMLLY